ncbi:hypothetical protein KJY73_14830 [Bowmanella sp. Y26]|uniref:hypothetical protein n=1 Tax=Bowmanella yangjiangensis TaxID=2811230 RepID=UPI001BDD2321|nr:hypothetical protein [Bowmanella yangjiangensis]MBT1064865.1 hypothetical protein [Bowmanella yangjiangensis]
MSDEYKAVDSLEVAKNQQGQNLSRRKWLKKAGVAAPALLLLANRPAMAMGCTISGFMSVQLGTSLTVHDGATCNGWSPGNWKNQNGQINGWAWNATGESPSSMFKSIFTTNRLSSTYIKRVVGGVPESMPMEFTSYLSSTLGQELSGNTKTNSITQHAAAAFLNAAFLANGGAGSNPDPWMVTYPSMEDIIGAYLLYEISHLSAAMLQASSGTVYLLERNGILLGRSDTMTVTEYSSFFNSIADGGGSQAWQDGL